MTVQIWPLINLYKRKLNEEHIRVILCKSNIHRDVLKKFMDFSSDNAYHNYGHTLGVMRTVIEICLAQNLDKRLTTIIAFAAGIHDSPHPGIATAADEIRSTVTMFDCITDGDLALCGLTSADRPLIRDLQIATIFSNRGKYTDTACCIIQDADIGYMGKGKYIYLLACIGLIDEFCRATFKEPDPVDFIRVQQKGFITSVINMSPNKDSFFLSEGAKKIMADPMQTLEEILLWPDAIYWLAYDLRQADISLEQFIITIDRQAELLK